MLFILVPLKAFSPIVVIPELIVIEDTSATFFKKLLEILLVSLLITKFILLQPVKANELTEDMLVEIVTFFKAVQPLNVFAPILVTLVGMDTLVNTLQF